MHPHSLLAERRLTLTQAARDAGVNPSTVWRWALSGARGQRLETYCLGQKRYTPVEALERFSAACTAASVTGQSAIQPRTPKQRDRDAERALAELRAMGI